MFEIRVQIQMFESQTKNGKESKCSRDFLAALKKNMGKLTEASVDVQGKVSHRLINGKIYKYVEPIDKVENVKISY